MRETGGSFVQMVQLRALAPHQDEPEVLQRYAAVFFADVAEPPLAKLGSTLVLEYYKAIEESISACLKQEIEDEFPVDLTTLAECTRTTLEVRPCSWNQMCTSVCNPSAGTR